MSPRSPRPGSSPSRSSTRTPARSVAWPWAAFALVVASGGFVIPGTTALAQEAGRRAAGTAASLQGGLQMLVGALATPLTGVFGYDSLLPMAVVMAGAYGLAVLAVLAVRRRERAAGRRRFGSG